MNQTRVPCDTCTHDVCKAWRFRQRFTEARTRMQEVLLVKEIENYLGADK